MIAAVHNLFANLVVPSSGEHCDELARSGKVRIERIVSSAEVEPIGYDQSEDEWVVVLRGHAELALEGGVVSLGPGDYLLLAAHTRHSVRRTSAGTVWLAVHMDPA